MAVVLGPELDLFLKGLGDDLKGRTQLDEPYVDKKTIVRSVREQNNVLLVFQQRILELEEKEKAFLATVNALQDRVCHLERYTEKVDRIEDTLEAWKEKIALVDDIADKVQVSSFCLTI